MYKWSYTNNYNTAVMGLNKYTSTFIKEFFDSIKGTFSSITDLIGIFHPIGGLTNFVTQFAGASSIYDNKKVRLYHSKLFGGFNFFLNIISI